MNNPNIDISFTELRCKDVISIIDGKKLGHITDIVFSLGTGRVCGIVVPFVRRTLFCKGQDLFIPWKCIKSIGEDVIIVDISSLNRVGPQMGGHGGFHHDHHDGCHGDHHDSCNDGCHDDHHDGGEKDCCHPPADVHPEHCPPPNCDRRCDKCMLFDCQFRWKGSRR